MAGLKSRVLSLLRDWRLEHGNCHHGIERIATEMNCEPKEIFDWDNDSGVLFELCDEGEVNRIGNDPFIAEGSMSFGGH